MYYNVLDYIYAKTGFRGSHCYEAMFQQPPMQDIRQDDDEDLHPCHEDEEFFGARPDTEEMEEAISEFMDGLEANECSGVDTLHSLLGGLPVPVQKKDSCMTVGGRLSA
jgi:hypothetical protein